MAEPARVLIIDDSDEDRATYRRILAGAGFAIHEAENGAAGIAACRSHRPDCILLDFNLPDLDGVQVIERLTAELDGSPPPVVVLTGQGSEAHAVAAMKSGAQDYLVKGLASVEVSRAIKSAIEHAMLRQRVKEQAAALEAHRQELLYASRMKDQFLATLAHELRNPLAPVGAATHILRTKCPAVPEVTKYTAVIDRQLVHLKRLIDDLLDVARVTSGKLDLQRQRTSLAAVTDNVVEQCADLLENKGGQTLNVHAPTTDAWLDVDQVRLVQTLVNVISNASKFSPPGTAIDLMIDIAEGDVEYTVKDRGVGLEEAWLERIFELFTQRNVTADRSTPGLGIGLSLAKQLTEMHGGTIRAKSQGLGHGSQFIIRLPVVLADSAGASTTSAQRQAPKNPASRRVLVVDDNRDVADMLQELCEMEGFTVAAAYDGLEAVRLAQIAEPDIILMDIGLPGIDGYEAVRRIRKFAWAKKAIVIAVTGWAPSSGQRIGDGTGFDHHIVKPVDPVLLKGFLGH